MVVKFYAIALLIALAFIPATCLSGNNAWSTDNDLEGGSINSVGIV